MVGINGPQPRDAVPPPRVEPMQSVTVSAAPLPECLDRIEGPSQVTYGATETYYVVAAPGKALSNVAWGTSDSAVLRQVSHLFDRAQYRGDALTLGGKHTVDATARCTDGSLSVFQKAVKVVAAPDARQIPSDCIAVANCTVCTALEEACVFFDVDDTPIPFCCPPEPTPTNTPVPVPTPTPVPVPAVCTGTITGPVSIILGTTSQVIFSLDGDLESLLWGVSGGLTQVVANDVGITLRGTYVDDDATVSATFSCPGFGSATATLTIAVIAVPVDPTATPLPTATPQPTNTPVPVVPGQPTNTPVPLPTATPVSPVNTPVHAVTNTPVPSTPLPPGVPSTPPDLAVTIVDDGCMPDVVPDQGQWRFRFTPTSVSGFVVRWQHQTITQDANAIFETPFPRAGIVQPITDPPRIGRIRVRAVIRYDGTGWEQPQSRAPRQDDDFQNFYGPWTEYTFVTFSAVACGFAPQPTNTPVPVPTSTPRPTNTPVPVDPGMPTNTPVPLPTNTPVPTNTPQPTATPVPTNTPVPSCVGQLTASPNPVLSGGTLAVDLTVTVGTLDEITSATETSPHLIITSMGTSSVGLVGTGGMGSGTLVVGFDCTNGSSGVASIVISVIVNTPAPTHTPTPRPTIPPTPIPNCNASFGFTDRWLFDFSESITDLVLETSGSASAGQFTYTRSPDFNHFLTFAFTIGSQDVQGPRTNQRWRYSRRVFSPGSAWITVEIPCENGLTITRTAYIRFGETETEDRFCEPPQRLTASLLGENLNGRWGWAPSNNPKTDNPYERIRVLARFDSPSRHVEVDWPRPNVTSLGRNMGAHPGYYRVTVRGVCCDGTPAIRRGRPICMGAEVFSNSVVDTLQVLP